MNFPRYDWELAGPVPVSALPSMSSLSLEVTSELPLVHVRRGGSCNEVALMLEEYGKCNVTGPPGCGKSSKFVEAIALDSRRPIVHLVPHPRLVEEFITRGYGSVRATSDLSSLFGVSCYIQCPVIIVSTYTRFLSMSIKEDRPILDVTMRPIYYCDECHDSDAATFSLVRQFKNPRSPHNAIMVSATLDGEAFADKEVGDPVVDKFLTQSGYGSEAFAKSVVSALKENTACPSVLMYSDIGTYDMSVLETAIKTLGYSWFWLHSRSTPEKFKAAMDLMRSAAKVVVCADSSYRSGFDFPVSMVIDSSLVSYRRASVPTEYKVRLAFPFELYQARGRLGRCALPTSQPLVYYRMRVNSPNAVTVIEGYEAVVAAHVIHAQGNDVPEFLRSFGIRPTSGYLRDYRTLDSNVRLSTTMLEVSRAQLRGKALRPPSSSSRSGKSGSVYGDPMASFSKLNLDLPKNRFVPTKIGTMVTVAGSMETDDCKTLAFPRGSESVRQLLTSPGLSKILINLTGKDVAMVSSVLSSDMNNLSCEFLAADALAKLVSKQDESLRSTSQIKWLKDFHTRLGYKASEFMAKSRDLQILVDESGVDFSELSFREFKDIISQLAATYISVYKAQENFWQAPSAIANQSRNKYIEGVNIATGYDSRGFKQISNIVELNNKKKEERRQPPQQSTSRTSVHKQTHSAGYGSNESVKHFKLNSSHPSVEVMRSVYPNAEFTYTPQRSDYEKRRSSSNSSRTGSWSNNGPKGLFNTSANTWKAPD